jgi:hypothetical protein
LPEAAFSLTLKGRLDGQDALLTVRGMTAPEFQRNLQAVRGVLDPAQVPAPDQGKDVCPIHNVTMQTNTKNGRTWKSHPTADGQWCKGKLCRESGK